MKVLNIILMTGIVLLPFNLIAQKPFHQWEKEDILTFFENNDIVYEGMFIHQGHQQDILIGKGTSESETIHYNFYLKEGILVKALITVTQNNAFQLVNHEVELYGFEKVSETTDPLGNRYRKYTNKHVEIIVINKSADWPEMYFHP